jgi:DNA repair protein RecO (recombination protein O)
VTAVRDEVLLLRRFPYGETSLVVHGLSKAHGRVHLLAKGAYRPSSRYCGVLDLFDTLDLEWSHSAGRELQLLREGSIAVRRHRIAERLEAYRAALAVLELAELGALLEQPSESLYECAVQALDALVLAASGVDSPRASTGGEAKNGARAAVPRAVSCSLALVVFELSFLQNLGLAPALQECASCGGPAPALARRESPSAGAEASRRAAFSASSGGRLCARCAAEARAAGRRVGTLPVRVLEQAGRLAAVGQSGARDASLTSGEIEQVRDFVVRFLEYQLQGRPKSYRAFLSGPNRNRPR